MSAVTGVVLPTSKAVRDLLEDMLGRDIDVARSEPLVPSPKVRSAIAVYVDARLRAGAIVAVELPLAAFAGAAIGLVPRGGANECVEEGELSPTISENLHEVLNICSMLFNQPGARHLRLYKVYDPSELPPVDISAYLRTLGRRLDLSVRVAGYGAGKLGVVLT